MFHETPQSLHAITHHVASCHAVSPGRRQNKDESQRQSQQNEPELKQDLMLAKLEPKLGPKPESKPGRFGCADYVLLFCGFRVFGRLAELGRESSSLLNGKTEVWRGVAWIANSSPLRVEVPIQASVEVPA